MRNKYYFLICFVAFLSWPIASVGDSNIYPSLWKCENVCFSGSEVQGSPNESETAYVPPYYYEIIRSPVTALYPKYHTIVVTRLSSYSSGTPSGQDGWMVKAKGQSGNILDDYGPKTEVNGMTFGSPGHPGAFSDCSLLKKVVIPPTIKEIGSEAFKNCTLTELVCMATTPPTLETGAFNAVSIEKIIIPKGTLTTYQNTTGWKDFELVEGAEKYSKGQMAECDGAWYEVNEGKAMLITSGDIPDSQIPETIMVLINGEMKTIPVTSLGNWSVGRDLVLNSLIESIPTNYSDGRNYPVVYSVYSYKHNKSAYSIYANETLTFYYDDRIHGGDRLPLGQHYVMTKSVVFDPSFANYHDITSTNGWFEGMKSLSSIKGLQYLDTRNVTDMGSMFEGCSSLTSIDLSSFNTSNVTNMQKMFMSCNNLSSLNLSSFNTSNVKNMEEMFCGCRLLNYLNLDNFDISDVTNTDKMFYDSGIQNLTMANATSIGEECFNWCSSLTNLNIPNALSIDDYAFIHCSNLTSVEIPKVISIGKHAFFGCTNLTSVEMPKVTSIGTYAFGGCTNLTSVNMPSVISIDTLAFCACSNLTSVYMPKVSSIKDRAFIDCLNLTSVELPNVTFIDVLTFQGNNSLTDVNIPKVTSIGTGAFGDCTKLTSINMPSVSLIGVEAFYDCTSLTSVVIPEGVTSIGRTAFSGCTNLKSVTALMKDPILIGKGWNGAFNNISSNCALYVPKGTKETYIAKGWTESVFKGGIYEIAMVTGDINNDNAVSMSDANMVVNAFLNGEGLEGADMNGDGQITMSDANQIVNMYLQGNK